MLQLLDSSSNISWRAVFLFMSSLLGSDDKLLNIVTVWWLCLRIKMGGVWEFRHFHWKSLQEEQRHIELETKVFSPFPETLVQSRRAVWCGHACGTAQCALCDLWAVLFQNAKLAWIHLNFPYAPLRLLQFSLSRVKEIQDVLCLKGKNTQKQWKGVYKGIHFKRQDGKRACNWLNRGQPSQGLPFSLLLLPSDGWVAGTACWEDSSLRAALRCVRHSRRALPASPSTCSGNERWIPAKAGWTSSVGRCARIPPSPGPREPMNHSKAARLSRFYSRPK